MAVGSITSGYGSISGIGSGAGVEVPCLYFWYWMKGFLWQELSFPAWVFKYGRLDFVAKMKDYFYNFIQDRVEDIRLDIALNNRTCGDYFKEVVKLKQDILANLPDEKKHLLIDFESVDSLLEASIQEEIYRIALVDVIEICNYGQKSCLTPNFIAKVLEKEV